MQLDPLSRDLAIRTVLAEAGGSSPLGQAGVASVIRNRFASGQFGKSVHDVVLAPYQFEPWLHAGTGKNNDPERFDPNSTAYKQAGGIVDAVFNGGPDPTGGATHFINPALQQADGRKMPQWASGTPLTSIDGHDFYAPNGAVKGNTMYPMPTLQGLPGTNPAQSSSPLLAFFGGAAGAGGTPNGQGTGGAMPSYTPNFLGQLLFGQQGLRGATQSALGKLNMPNGLLGAMFGLGPQQQLPTAPGGLPTGTPAATGTPNLPQQGAPQPIPGQVGATGAMPQQPGQMGNPAQPMPGLAPQPQGIHLPQAAPQQIAQGGAPGLPQGGNGLGFMPPMAGGGMGLPPSLLASIFGGA